VPTGTNGIRLDHDAAATPSLLSDLRSDRGMEWIPPSGWLTKVAVDGTAAQLSYDLAIDASGARQPSAVAAGLALPGAALPTSAVDVTRLLLALGLAVMGLLGIALMVGGRPGNRLAG
jgi:hypothetical protein